MPVKKRHKIPKILPGPHFKLDGQDAYELDDLCPGSSFLRNISPMKYLGVSGFCLRYVCSECDKVSDIWSRHRYYSDLNIISEWGEHQSYTR